jgi:hypothetical protein
MGRRVLDQVDDPYSPTMGSRSATLAPEKVN